MQDGDRDIGHEVSVGESGETRQIAYRTRNGKGPTIVWLGGYRSDMRGTKAEHLLEIAAREDRAFMRLDYSGHGESGGRFEEGTISRWTEDALAAIEASGAQSVLLVGSSMGAWIALNLLARARAGQASLSVEGLLLLAPAPDFTERLMRPRLSPSDLADIEAKGRLEEPSDYSDEPNIYTKALFDDGAANLVMDGPIETGCPVAIIQGMEDPDVPYGHALALMACLSADDATMTLIKDGDHRLSRPKDLDVIDRILMNLIEQREA
ncbi:alpha/beta hydrolase [Fulvimarina sp. MAC3]|uniref:alpha/beta hydrolase n=1 Tax=Fulvimarina sp. MAC3 TaxID=3148887 RepID=UPI0031FD2E89